MNKHFPGPLGVVAAIAGSCLGARLATGAVFSETYVAVQVRDLEGPVVGTGSLEVGFSDEGVGTEAEGHARIVLRDIHDFPVPVKLGVSALASVGDPGPAGDTGALAVASARAVTHVHAYAGAAGVIPTITFASLNVTIEGVVTPIGQGAAGAVHATALLFDPISIGSSTQKSLNLTDIRSALDVKHELSLGIFFPLLGGLFDYTKQGLALDLSLGVEAHATGRNSVIGVDFSGTMEIASFNFYDEQGRLVEGMSVLDETGASYPANVPEPLGSTTLSVAMAGTALFAKHYRRRGLITAR
jgi:hypothetical protein